MSRCFSVAGSSFAVVGNSESCQIGGRAILETHCDDADGDAPPSELEAVDERLLV